MKLSFAVLFFAPSAFAIDQDEERLGWGWGWDATPSPEKACPAAPPADFKEHYLVGLLNYPNSAVSLDGT
jgi:hypothetical protein